MNNEWFVIIIVDTAHPMGQQIGSSDFCSTYTKASQELKKMLLEAIKNRMALLTKHKGYSNEVLVNKIENRLPIAGVNYSINGKSAVVNWKWGRKTIMEIMPIAIWF